MKPAEATETGVTAGRNQTNLDSLTSDQISQKNTDVITHKINKQGRKLTIGETESELHSGRDLIANQHTMTIPDQSRSKHRGWFQTTCNNLSFKLKLIMIT